MRVSRKKRSLRKLIFLPFARPVVHTSFIPSPRLCLRLTWESNATFKRPLSIYFNVRMTSYGLIYSSLMKPAFFMTRDQDFPHALNSSPSPLLHIHIFIHTPSHQNSFHFTFRRFYLYLFSFLPPPPRDRNKPSWNSVKNGNEGGPKRSLIWWMSMRWDLPAGKGARCGTFGNLETFSIPLIMKHSWTSTRACLPLRRWNMILKRWVASLSKRKEKKNWWRKGDIHVALLSVRICGLVVW